MNQTFFLKLLLAISPLSLASATDQAACELENNAVSLDVKMKNLNNELNDIKNKSESKTRSKWSASRISEKDCKALFAQIDKRNVTSAPIPELLSAIDVISAECGYGDDPKIVIKDNLAFRVEGTDLYFNWNDEDKLEATVINLDAKDGPVFEYSLVDLEKGTIELNKDQTEFLKTNGLKITEIESPKTDKKSFVGKWWSATKSNVEKIATEGQTDIYLPMIAYHDRGTYTNIDQLNEKAFGLGIGKSITNKNGNTEMLFAMAHLDSHADIEFNVGYGWQKNFQATEKTKLGIGYAAGIISRKDIYDHAPIPFILPMASVDYDKKISINGVLIPKLNGGINHGNVLFVFAKYTWDK